MIAIKGFVARDKDGQLCVFYGDKPHRGKNERWWHPEHCPCGDWMNLPEDMFPEIEWKNEPMKVEIIISMDYEKLHKDTIAKLQEMVNSGKITVKTACDICADFVPESDDERIRKELIDFLEYYRLNNVLDSKTISLLTDSVAWLEKQGKKEEEILVLKDQIESLHAARKALKETHRIELEKQGKQNQLIERGKWYVCIETYKFFVKGSAYQARNRYCINGDGDDCFVDGHDGKLSDYFRPWNVKDARDGDVLACPNDAGDRDVVFIFKNINSDEGWVFCFCAIDANGCFCTNNDYVGNSNSTNISPATKEQRDLLFQKMKDAGYEWDANKKELKCIIE